MLKSILLNCLLLSTTTVFANDFMQQDQKKQDNKNEEHLCYVFGDDYNKCKEWPKHCFWDYEDGRCEPLKGTITRCMKLGPNPKLCNSQPDCFWDYNDNRCETLN